MSDFTISYSSGWPDWYVSVFYKYFHAELEKKLNIKLDYIELRELNKQYGIEQEVSSDSIFGHYSLIIKCNKSGKLFVHSWYDHAFATLEWCERHNLDVVLFSGVSNITKNFVSARKNVQPSVYCLEFWSDHSLIEAHKHTTQKKTRAYFAGLSYGIREHLIETLGNNSFFDIHNKSKLYVQKSDYYKEISESHFGLSFNGAANICYRDLELFGLGTINLRQTLTCETYEPLISGVHYYNFLDDMFVDEIISYHAFNRLDKEFIEQKIQIKVNEVIDFINTKTYNDMLEESLGWFDRNCTIDNQVKIISSFLKEFTIFD